MFESTASSSIFVFVRLIAERPFTLLSFPPSLSSSSSSSPPRFDVNEDEQSNRDARDRRLEYFERHHDDDDAAFGAIDVLILLAETEVLRVSKTCTKLLLFNAMVKRYVCVVFDGEETMFL